jgi:hypothetical protein
MKQRLITIFILVLVSNLTFSQIVDRYGINIGASYSTQIWDYKLISFDTDNDYKVGPMAFIQAEKDFGKILAIRTEIGYIQKGFKSQLELTFEDEATAVTINDNVILHDLA